MIRRFELNNKGKDYVVGDIHGCFSELTKALDEIGFDVEVDRLFCTGDLVDRGPESHNALIWLDYPWFFSVRGNHEQMLINMTRGTSDPILYMHNGGKWFFTLSEEEQRIFAETFQELPLAIEIETPNGRVGLVHAEVPDNNWESLDVISPNRKTRETAMWARTRITYKYESAVEGIDKVYCGHTPVKDVVRLGNVYYIDTGAVYPDGKFTIVNLTDKENNNNVKLTE